MLPRSLVPVALAAAALAAGAPAAGAASKTAIAYVQDGDVHVVDPDSTGVHALSADAGDTPYRRPRLAADGSVWALHGWDLVHLAAGGGRIGTIPVAPPKDSRGVVVEEQPAHLDLSPDGTKAVWSVTSTRCPDDCYRDGITGVVDLAGGRALGEQHGLTETAFLDDGHLIGIDSGWLGEVRTATLTGPSVLWYDDRDLFGAPYGTPRQPAVSADKGRFATLRTVSGVGVGVFLYKIAPAATAAGLAVPPQQVCVINNVDVTQATPSWSPDGHSVVVAQKDGLAAYDVSEVDPGDDCGKKAKFTGVADKGAFEPDWGVVPGTVPDPPGATAPAPPAPASASVAPAHAPVVVPRPAPVTAAGPRLTVTAQRLSAVLRSGLRVRLSGLRAGKTKVVVKARGRVVATKAVTVPTGGTLTTSVKLSAAGRRALRRARSATLTITAAGATATVRVKR